ncbi:tRNA (adenosine(37)-N6)-threonylcarbamoyltransferase complex dimerization subunit type 1 TsaB [Adhaeribacter swui]|uniref:tRNA (Adenosine(37)-N6)-threonylcarbamoyltransferase complex dimerization subunit type 1 TsaB n=1 Tax=Adhaeribacter swui TaxID=2086471 RepID=A0A7G7GDT0_9BACT|nr:tRNA (adenosine(37)-N6)-threonylcarbamoyltransferase complex dimerization subunit type 1 TsaB [Adhaeribacter swui]QNF35314.1 tRNA (adenosine(37)-N6)-threonylcarbamoyltransferase complex dimerization subunit type 1 TsaB [Adhaeribacter swui]
MAILLAIETSSSICSVALFHDQQLLALSELQIEKSHSSHITVLINQMIANCNLSMMDISAVAVSSGPGSYTGLRIGTSIAKGLCFSLNLPLLEVSTLHALASAQIQITPQAEKFLFCPMLDARRMEVYTCIVNHLGEEQFPIKPVILSSSTFEEYLVKQPILFFGSGATKFQTLIGNHSNGIFVHSLPISAKYMGAIAYHKFNTQQYEDVAYYEPFYLKEVYITSGTKLS